MSNKEDHTLVTEDEVGVGNETANSDEFPTVDKINVMSQDAKALTKLSIQFIVIAAGIGLLGYLLKFIWVGLLPVVLAMLIATVLFPIARLLRSWKFPSALAAITVLLGFFVVIGGVFAAMTPIVRSQGGALVTQAQRGLNTIIDMVDELPIDLQTERIQQAINDFFQFIQGQVSNIATGVATGVSAAGSFLVGMLIMLVITFFILKDGDSFLPWLRKYTGPTVGWHVTELFSRIWKTLSGFIQTQGLVALVDAVFIGLGLWALQVPLAFVIAVVTFFAGFIPIIGAVTAGILAVAIALVSNGLTNALLVLLLIIIVQQVEGNILQPVLQSKAMGLHAALVLLSVTVGSALAGILGAFLAVPVAATIAVILRYHAEMVSLRAGEIWTKDLTIATGAGTADSKPDEDNVSEIAQRSEQDAVVGSPREKVIELFAAMGPTKTR